MLFRSTTGTTKIILDETTIHAARLVENENTISIEIAKPKEIYSKVLILDIGHGGTDSGAVGNGVQEKVINFNQAMAIKAKLEAQTDIKVYMTREDDSSLTLAYRTELANEIDGDIFISVHNNSVPSSTTVSGTEVWYYPNTLSTQMATIMQRYLVNAVGTVSRGAKSSTGLYVLRTSNMPAILLEGGFISNPTEAARLNSSDFTQKYAQGAVDAIVEIFNTLSFR